VTVIAGPLAENRAMGRLNLADSLHDYGSVLMLLARRLDGVVTLRQIEARADALLSRQWRQVERIVRALLRRQRLSAGDVFDLLDADDDAKLDSRF
jgi:hypothetical protein